MAAWIVMADAKKMRKLFSFFILFGLILASCEEVQSSVPTPITTSTPAPIPTSTIGSVPQFVENKQYWAILGHDRATFWFMVNPDVTEWTWYKAPDGFIEYEWGVEFPISENPYPIYSAEVTLIPDKKDLLPQKGNIAELLEQCESGLWLMDRGGMENLNMDKAVETRYFNGGVLIELTNFDIIAELYRVHPKTLLFKTYSRSNVLPSRKVNVTIIYQ